MEEHLEVEVPTAKRSRRELRILLLNCDDTELYGQLLPDMLRAWLGPSTCSIESVCAKLPNSLPSVEMLQGYDGIIVGGSLSATYEDLPWLEPLRGLLRDIAANNKLPHVLGICFGHQILAEALGGEVKKNVEHGFQLGARKWQVESDVIPGMSSVRALVAHGDVVTCLPPDSVRLGCTSTCAHEGFRAAEGRILTFQCHPEFGASDAGRRCFRLIIDHLLKTAEIDKDTAERATADVGTTVANDNLLAEVALAHFKARVAISVASASANEKKRAVWNRITDAYILNIEELAAGPGRALASCLGLKNASSVLDMGCGSGLLTLDILRMIDRPDAQVIAADFAENMAEKTAGRFAGAANVSVRQGDAMDLSWLSDASLDRYLANLLIMIVPEPDMALREAARVLKPGGKAGFSVWGRRGESPMFTLLVDVCNELGFHKMTYSSLFNLGENEIALRQRVLAAGFSQVIMWHQPMVQNTTDGAVFATRILESEAASTEAWLNELSAEKRSKLHSTLAERAEQLISIGKPICLDMIMIVAVK